jgi:hypothetical protein
LSQEKAAAALLRSQIIDDPEQLRRVISDMHHSVEREVCFALRVCVREREREEFGLTPPLTDRKSLLPLLNSSCTPCKRDRMP